MAIHRAHLPGGRTGTGLLRLEREVERILQVLAQSGAVRVEPAVLQPAKVLLDLYGEDIRARAFVTEDDGAEMMLRPDFTVPIVRMHMAGARAAAAYVYCGPVWRRQEAGSTRPREYLQAGIEIYDDPASDPVAADAAVLALVRDALAGAPVEIVTGDLGLALAAIDGLATSVRRKAALRRHLWRPSRFHQLLQRFGSEHAAVAGTRRHLLAAEAEGRVAEAIAAAAAPVGLRSADEIAERVSRMATEAETPPLSPGAVAGLEAVLGVSGTCAAALDEYRAMTGPMPGLAPAVARFAARLEAFAERGISPEELRFEASFGRTTLEYYDGFVFGAVARDRPELPPIASGGRYDALTRVLGGGGEMPAVGGIIRPEALVALRETPCA